MESIRDKHSNYLRNLDGIQGYSTEFYFSARIGKHYCPYCNGLLKIRRKEQIVNSESEGAKKFSLYTYGGGSGGNFLLAWDVYCCTNCDKEISTGIILDYERELKKIGGNIDFDAFLERNKNPNLKKHNWPSLLLACAIIAIVTMAVIVIANRYSW